MKQFYLNVKSYLQQLLSGEPPHRELTNLIHLSRSIIESHFSINRSSLSVLCTRQGLTITDLAYDCIAEAFVRNDENRFTQIENFTKSLNTSLDDTPEVEVFIAFKQFLLRISEAQLARLYAQSDPAGAKIHRNIRECIKSSKCFTIEKDFRGLVIRPSSVGSLDHLEEFPPEQFEREFLEQAKHADQTPELLRCLYEILAGQSTYRRSITLIATTQLFKKIYRSDVNIKDNNESLSPDCLTEFELEQIQKQVEFSLKEKIVLTYLARGKVSRNEAEGMFKAFQALIDDWRNDNVGKDGLYHHLKQHLEINPEIYEAQYRPKMEYLLKIAREEFAARLLREL